METIYAHPSDMLAVMAGTLGGDVFHTIMCVDAVVILCGGVLTAIIGKWEEKEESGLSTLFGSCVIRQFVCTVLLSCRCVWFDEAPCQ